MAGLGSAPGALWPRAAAQVLHFQQAAPSPGPANNLAIPHGSALVLQPPPLGRKDPLSRLQDHQDGP